MQVLIVEDEALVALDLAEMVEGLGHSVIGPCTSAAAALDALDRHAPDFAILDFNLRIGNSTPVAEALRLRHVPFVFLTGYRRDALPGTFAAMPLLSKPVNLGDLEAALTHRSTPAQGN